MAESEHSAGGMAVDSPTQDSADALALLAAAMLEAAPSGMLLLDHEGNVQLANSAAREMLDLPAGRLQRPLFDFIPAHFHDSCRELIASTAGSSVGPRVCQLIALRGDGTPFTAELCITELAPFPGHYCANLRPVELPTTSDYGIDSTRLLLERVIDDHPSMLVVRDSEGRVVLCNASLSRYYGYRPAEVVGLYHQDLWRSIGMSEEKITEWIAEDQVVLESGRALDYIQQYVDSEGTISWYHNQKTLLRLADGRPCILVSYSDITERKLTDEALRKSEARFRTVFENAAVGIAVVTREGRYTQANSVFQNLLGYSLEELLAIDAFDLTPDEDWPRTRPLFDSLLSGERKSFTTEKRYIRRDGSLIWLDLWATPLYDSEGQIEGVLGIFADITDRRRQHKERERLIEELSEALMTVKALSGLVPICSSCKKIRDDQGYWNKLEEYLARHSDARLSHGICEECAETLYPELGPGEAKE